MDLPDEIWWIIFGFVDSKDIRSLYRVCRRWKSLCQNSVRFDTLNLMDYPRIFHEELIHNIYQINHIVWKDPGNKQNLQKFINVKSIEIWQCSCPKLLYWVGKQQQLVKLKLKMVNLHNLFEISKCNKLISIILEEDKEYNEPNAVFKKLNNLKTLKLYNISLRDYNMVGLSKNLTEIVFVYAWNLSDTTLMHIGQQCSFLERITLSYNFIMTELGIDALAQGCSLLKYAKITACYEIDDYRCFINLIQQTQIRDYKHLILDDLVTTKVVLSTINISSELATIIRKLFFRATNYSHF